MPTDSRSLTPKQRDALKGRTAAVWAATYAAEWQRLFTETAKYNGFDHVEQIDHAERACTVADLAVWQMRRWEKHW